MDTALFKGEEVYAPDLKRGSLQAERIGRGYQQGQLRCKGCRQRVIMNLPTWRRNYFRHEERPDGCPFIEGDYANESPAHRETKLRIAVWLRGRYGAAAVTVEKYLPSVGRIADVFLEAEGQRVAFEIQKSPLLPEEWEQRSFDYERAGVKDFWLLMGEAAPARPEATNYQARPVPVMTDWEYMQVLKKKFARHLPRRDEKVAQYKMTPLAEHILQLRRRLFILRAREDEEEEATAASYLRTIVASALDVPVGHPDFPRVSVHLQRLAESEEQLAPCIYVGLGERGHDRDSGLPYRGFPWRVLFARRIEDLKLNLEADPWSEAWGERPFISMGEVHERVCLQPALWRKKNREHYECWQEWLEKALEEHKQETGMHSMCREERIAWVTGRRKPLGDRSGPLGTFES